MMKSLEEALALIRSCRREARLEELPLRDALGRILPEPLNARLDQPPFDKAAMDGWLWLSAAGAQKPDRPLRIRGTVAAGEDARGLDGATAGSLGPGEALRIMTGAALPAVTLSANDVADSEGRYAPRIQRFEWASERDGMVVFDKTESEDNIIRRGENLLAGAGLLGPRVLKAQDIAILAADGRPAVKVACLPRVGVLSTGTELRDAMNESAAPDSAMANCLSGGGVSIFDSNRPQILAQLADFPCRTLDYGIVSDDFTKTVDTLASMFRNCDLVVLSGGVSMGDFDYVPKALQSLGVETVFHGLAVKPGKPTYFGRLVAGDTRYVIGLPGNPVSVFINTELLVKPLVAALGGLDYALPTMALPLATGVSRRNADRAEFLPVRLVEGGIQPVPYGGSSALQALAAADGILVMPAGCAELAKGANADVRLIR